MKNKLLIETEKFKSLISRMDKKLSYDEYLIHESKQLLTEAKIDLMGYLKKSLNAIGSDASLRLKIGDEIVEELTSLTKFLDGDMGVALKGKTDEILQALVDSGAIKTMDSLPLKKYLETADGLSNLGKGGKKSDVLDVIVKDGTNIDDATNYLIDFLIDNDKVSLQLFDEISDDGVKLRRLLEDPKNKELRSKFIESFFSDAWRNFDSMSESFKSLIIKQIREFGSSNEVVNIASMDKLPKDLAGTDILFKNVDGVDRYFAVKNMDESVIKYLEKNGWGKKKWNDFAQNAGQKGTTWKQKRMHFINTKALPYLKFTAKYGIPVGILGRAIECWWLSDDFKPQFQYDEVTKENKMISDWTFGDCFTNVYWGDVDVGVPDDWKPTIFTWEAILAPGIGSAFDGIMYLGSKIRVFGMEMMMDYISTEVKNEKVRAARAAFEKLPLIGIINSKCSVDEADVRAMKEGVIRAIKEKMGEDAPDSGFSMGLDEVLGLGLDKYDKQLDDIINTYQDRVAEIDELRKDVKDQYEANSKYKVKVNIEDFPELDFQPDIKGSLKHACIVAQTDAAIESYNAHQEIVEKTKNEGTSTWDELYDNSKWNLEWYTEDGNLNSVDVPNNVSVEACEYNKDKFKNLIQLSVNSGGDSNNLTSLEKSVVCSKDNMDKLLLDYKNTYKGKSVMEDEGDDIKNKINELIEISEKEGGIEVTKASLRNFWCWENTVQKSFPIDSYINKMLELSYLRGNNDLANIIKYEGEDVDYKKIEIGKTGKFKYIFKLKGNVIDSIGDAICNCTDYPTKGVKFEDENGKIIDAYDLCMRQFKDKLIDANIFNSFAE